MLKTFTTLLAGAFSLVVHAQEPSPALIGYWHNWNDGAAPYIPLDQVDPRYDVIDLAFAEPAGGSTYDMQFVPSGTTMPGLAAEVDVVHAQGRKVLISIGGANATVQLNSDLERDQFVTGMMGILMYHGLDGIDIDLEGSSVSISGGTIATPIDARIIRLIQAIETIGDQYEDVFGIPMMLTMAPETAYVQGGMSAFGGIWGAYLPIIHALRDRIDFVHVQLYNSGSMYGIDGGIYTQATADFIVSQTEAMIQGFNTGGGFFEGLAPEQVAVGLPACASAAGGGYTDTATVRAAMEYLLGTGPQPGSYTLQQPGGYPALRGMMTWSINWDAVSACNGTYSYAENYERIFGDITTGVGMPGRTSLMISPNPAVEELMIPVLQSAARISIVDATGRVVRRSMLTTGQSRIAIDQLLPGSYALVVEDDHRHWTARFVKQ